MNILEEMYDSELFNLIKTKDMEKRYHDTLRKVVATGDLLKEKYPECSELLEEYQTAESELQHIINRHEFCKGFRAGAQIVLEIIKPIG